MLYPMVDSLSRQQANIALDCNPVDPGRIVAAYRTGHGWLLSVNVGASLFLTSQYIIDLFLHDCIAKETSSKMCGDN